MSIPGTTTTIVQLPAAAPPTDSITPAIAPAAEPVAAPAPPVGITPQDVHTARDWLIAANPGIVPELVQGSTLDELAASLPAAKAAYERIAALVAAQQAHTVGASSAGDAPTAPLPVAGQQPPPATPPIVPNGAVPPATVDPRTLTTTQKLTLGVTSRIPQ